MLSYKNILYIHGMGGGGDSRIPAVLKDCFSRYDPSGMKIRVTVRTYSFDPEAAVLQINAWIDEIRPDLIIGESLGAIHAIRIQGLPHILVSPSLGGPKYLGYMAFLSLIPGINRIMKRIYPRKDGDRQDMDFSFKILRKYRLHRKNAIANSPSKGGKDFFFAFFGKKDHYRKTGVVSLRAYRKYFGDTYQIYDGTHFMEEEFIYKQLVQKIIETLGTVISQD